MTSPLNQLNVLRSELRVIDAQLVKAEIRAPTVLGILPIALALGAGAESRVPMVVAILGGLLIGTGLTLYAVPAMYSYITTKKERQELAWEPVEEPAVG